MNMYSMLLSYDEPCPGEMNKITVSLSFRCKFPLSDEVSNQGADVCYNPVVMRRA